MNNKLVTALLDKSRPGWKKRKATRKSPWHILKLILLFSSFMFFFFLFLYGYKLLQLNLFSSADLSGNSGMGILPLMIPALGLGLIVTNIILHLIPAARVSFEGEAKDDSELIYKPIMLKFIPMVFKYILPIGFGLSATLMWLFNA